MLQDVHTYVGRPRSHKPTDNSKRVFLARTGWVSARWVCDCGLLANQSAWPALTPGPPNRGDGYNSQCVLLVSTGGLRARGMRDLSATGRLLRGEGHAQIRMADTALHLPVGSSPMWMAKGTLLALKRWSGRMDLNHRPPGPEPGI